MNDTNACFFSDVGNSKFYSAVLILDKQIKRHMSCISVKELIGTKMLMCYKQCFHVPNWSSQYSENPPILKIEEGAVGLLSFSINTAISVKQFGSRSGQTK